MRWTITSKTFKRLDKLLASQIPELTRSKIEKLIKSGFCLVNGIMVSKAGFLIKPNDTVELELVESPRDIFQPPELEVLYEDDHLILINKPAGVLVHPGAGKRSPTVVDFLVKRFGQAICSVGSSERPGIVHRLDKDVSGLLVCAKTSSAYKNLTRQFSSHIVTKVYRSWNCLLKTSPFWKQSSFNLKTYLHRNPQNRTRFICGTTGSMKAKLAEAEFRVIEIFPPFAHLEIMLKTGRTHQIRAQSQFLKAPIVGDDWYGQSYKKLRSFNANLAAGFEGKGILLHASAIQLFHPVSGHKITFSSELPERFVKFRAIAKSVQL